MISVNELIEILNENDLLTNVAGKTHNFIDAVTNDSRRVGPKDLFIAIRGEESDGHMFIDKAVKNGAIAIVYEVTSEEISNLSSDVTSVHVTSSRRAEALIADLVVNHASRNLDMIGITGTNGKTSTTYLSRSLLQRAGRNTGLIGTVESLTPKRTIPSTQTTPGPLELHRLLGEMVSDGCDTCVMEVSSHAIAQDRTFGISYKSAVFTNLSQDHLDYHESMEDYFLTKKKMFDVLDVHATAIVNADDAHSERIVSDTAATVMSFGTSEKCDVTFKVLGQNFDGLRLDINGRRGQFNLSGEFNASNLACTYAIASSLGLDDNLAFELLLESERVPGRFESLRTNDDRLVVIDYAHTPDALEKILVAVGKVKPPQGKIWAVFGSGGDRDKSKRKLMAQVAEAHSNVIILTSDNPRTEDPEKIIDDIAHGLTPGTDYQRITDREKAIAFAASTSAPGDIVVIAGKGSETYQVIGREKFDFDDREKVRLHFPISHR